MNNSLEQASSWVARFAPLIPPGEVLDLACGGGRHARLLAAMGLRVLAVDRDPEALAKTAGEGISTLLHDLEAERPNEAVWPFASGRFTGIVASNYLHRPLFPHLIASLAVGGVLIYETFALGNERFGKPSNPDYLLAPGELLDVIRVDVSNPLKVIAFEDGYMPVPRPAMIQRICAMKSQPMAGEIAPDRVRLF